MRQEKEACWHHEDQDKKLRHLSEVYINDPIIVAEV